MIIIHRFMHTHKKLHFLILVLLIFLCKEEFHWAFTFDMNGRCGNLAVIGQLGRDGTICGLEGGCSDQVWPGAVSLSTPSHRQMTVCVWVCVSRLYCGKVGRGCSGCVLGFLCVCWKPPHNAVFSTRYVGRLGGEHATLLMDATLKVVLFLLSSLWIVGCVKHEAGHELR